MTALSPILVFLRTLLRCDSMMHASNWLYTAPNMLMSSVLLQNCFVYPVTWGDAWPRTACASDGNYAALG